MPASPQIKPAEVIKRLAEEARTEIALESLGQRVIEVYQIAQLITLDASSDAQAANSKRPKGDISGNDLREALSPALLKPFVARCLDSDNRAIRRDRWTHSKYPASVTGIIRGMQEPEWLKTGRLLVGHGPKYFDDIHVVASGGQPLVEFDFVTLAKERSQPKRWFWLPKQS